MSLDCGGEYVAYPAHGLNQGRAIASPLELAPQSADLNVDTAVERERDSAPRKVQQLIARQHPLRMLDKSEQHIVLAGG